MFRFRTWLVNASILLGSLALLSGCTLPWQQKYAGLKVQAADGPPFQVYLDDIHLGQAPVERNDLKPGTYRIKLDPGNGTKMYEGPIRLHHGTVSSVLWSFAGDQSTGTGEILELEPLPSSSRAELSVITIPEGSTVQLNNTTYGLSPVILDEAQAGQYPLTLNAVGHVKKTIQVRIEAGHRLHVFSRLERSSESLSPPPTASAEPTATGSGDLAPPPTPTGATNPTPPTTGAQTATNSGSLTPPYLTIKETGTGWLRVRAEASSSGAEVTRVDVGTRHSVQQVQNGWYQIEYEPGKFGWVSGQYVDYVPGANQ